MKNFINLFRKQYIYIVVIFLLLTNCMKMSSVYYPHQLPDDRKDLSEFPKKYQGKFYNEKDSTTIIIDQTHLGLAKYYEQMESKEKVEEEFDMKITRKTKGIIDKGVWINFDLKNDSVLLSGNFEDTIFTISDKTKLRKFRGMLFLNFGKNREGIDYWQVATLKLKSNKLAFQELIYKSEVDSLPNFIKVSTIKSEDSVAVAGYLLQMKNCELKKYLKIKSYNYNYQKIK